MKRNSSLDWTSFKTRFEEFVRMMSIGEIKLSNDGLPALTQSLIWPNTRRACRFTNHGLSCKSKIYQTSHPKLIFETMLGEGFGKDGMIAPPTIARVDLSLAKQKDPEDDLLVFEKLHTLLSIIFIFKPKPTEVEVYSSVWLNGVVEEADSLTFCPCIVGAAICFFAERFEKTVVKEKEEAPCADKHK